MYSARRNIYPLIHFNLPMDTQQISVFQDEYGSYCVITGTKDRGAAEKALRETETEWYGAESERSGEYEAPIPMDKFYVSEIYYGKYKGEEAYYWGNKPDQHFDDGKYTTEDGFVAVLD